MGFEQKMAAVTHKSCHAQSRTCHNLCKPAAHKKRENRTGRIKGQLRTVEESGKTERITLQTYKRKTKGTDSRGSRTTLQRIQVKVSLYGTSYWYLMAIYIYIYTLCWYDLLIFIQIYLYIYIYLQIHIGLYILTHQPYPTNHTLNINFFFPPCYNCAESPLFSRWFPTGGGSVQSLFQGKCTKAFWRRPNLPFSKGFFAGSSHSNSNSPSPFARVLFFKGFFAGSSYGNSNAPSPFARVPFFKGLVAYSSFYGFTTLSIALLFFPRLPSWWRTLSSKPGAKHQWYCHNSQTWFCSLPPQVWLSHHLYCPGCSFSQAWQPSPCGVSAMASWHLCLLQQLLALPFSRLLLLAFSGGQQNPWLCSRCLGSPCWSLQACCQLSFSCRLLVMLPHWLPLQLPSFCQGFETLQACHLNPKSLHCLPF